MCLHEIIAVYYVWAEIYTSPDRRYVPSGGLSAERGDLPEASLKYEKRESLKPRACIVSWIATKSCANQALLSALNVSISAFRASRARRSRESYRGGVNH